MHIVKEEEGLSLDNLRSYIEVSPDVIKLDRVSRITLGYMFFRELMFDGQMTPLESETALENLSKL